MRVKKGRKLVSVVRGDIDVQVWQMTASCPFGKSAMVGTYGCARCEFFEGSDSEAVECGAEKRGVMAPGAEVVCVCDEYYGLRGVITGLVDVGKSYVVRINGAVIVLDAADVRAAG